MSTESRILIADDNGVDRRILSKIVEDAGYQVIEAVDGHDAIAKYYSEQPDMVLLDALMPGCDGFDVARKIKADPSGAFVPIVFLTSLTETDELVKCLEVGGDDFLSKPYNRLILCAKLDALVRMREMHHTLQLQRDEIAKHNMKLIADQEAAKAVFDNVAHSRQLNAPYIKQVVSPLSLFNGDVLLTSLDPANNLFVLLGDFTGHGLAAAIGALPLSDVFYGMTAKGIPLPEIARECNRKMAAVLPAGYFCCAALICVDFTRKTLQFWNGGLPSVYLRRFAPDAGMPVLSQLPSNHLPLGVLSSERFVSEPVIMELADNDRIFLATDGVIEARNTRGEYFTEQRLTRILTQTAPEQLLEVVQDEVQAFISDSGHEDDLTMVEIQVVAEPPVGFRKSIEDLEMSGPRDWKFAYELCSSALKDFNPVPLLQQVVMEVPYLRSHATAIYTIMAELYSNALEHGVLGLSSDLKSSPEGFSQYYAVRARALENVEGFVRFELRGKLVDGVVQLWIKVLDSGRGFDYRQYLDASSQAQTAGHRYHGRGMGLIRDLSDSVVYSDPGNAVEVFLQWR